MKPLLIEIGTEEIPARFIADGINSLKAKLISLLTETSIEFKQTSVFATPRRLAVLIENVSEKQGDRKMEVLGPPEKAAFDAEGNPTPAAAGFARSQNIDVKALYVVKTDRGKYVAATIEETNRVTLDVLSEALPKLITSLQFPKSMRWGTGNLKFVRPIRWITALFGNTIIPFEIEGLKSGDTTRGHRFISPDEVRINDPAAYSQILLNNHVIADPSERKKIITEEIKKIETASNCIVHDDKELFETVMFLVEYPVVILGNFDAEYLSLPKELLVTVMKNHQKFFSVEDKNGDLLPHFVLISNSSPENNDMVKKGAERVFRARLEDARFYFDEDRKRPLWDCIEKLKHVTFQEKLGSVYEKLDRVAFICSFLAEELKLPDKEKILRAVMLSKADLVTGIVREFPELQGYIGMIYAENSGEDSDIATAINEHYKPRFSSDELPSNKIGAIISLADKIDNIASFFVVDMIPSGSEDPFALRRQAIGIINILVNRDYPFSLDALINKALQGLESYLPARKTLSTDILSFFYQRMEAIFSSEGFSHDVISAVLSIKETAPDQPDRQALPDAGKQTIKNIKNRLEILSQMKKSPDFTEFLLAAKRVCNILNGVRHTEVRRNLLTDDSEKVLFDTAGAVKSKLIKSEYRSLFDLKDPINTFFNTVMVMDKKPEIRENRLALLLSVKNIFDQLGDFSKVIE